MKYILIFCLFFVATSASSQTKINKDSSVTGVVEASCGSCQFKMAGTDCELAVKINGVAYLVDGTSIDAHGDAHAKDGFCNAIRKAKVKGSIVDNRFKATSFKLLPATKSKKQG